MRGAGSLQAPTESLVKHRVDRYRVLRVRLQEGVIHMDLIGEAKRRIDHGIEQGPFVDRWDSLRTYQIPSWYEEARFGIFIHWGVYSVPAFGNEWYPRNMYMKGHEAYRHHLEKYGPHDQFGYKDFIEKFTAEKFDPDQWASLFRRSGAKFVVPVAEHHDGFPMYDCSFTDWNAVKMGPRRDIIAELAEAVRKQWLVFGLSSHRAENWWFYHEGTKFSSDVLDPRYAGLYGPAQPRTTQPNEAFLDDWLARTCELVDKYEPQLVWFDWWIEQSAFEPYLRRFAAYYYNKAHAWQRGAVINYKHEAFPAQTAVLDIERGQLADIRPLVWQNDTSVSKNSWGYREGHDYKHVGDIVRDLVDVVSKNGALLLNIGPRPDGTIPEPEEEILLGVGEWLQVNGEAIYGARPWKVFGEGPTHVPEGSFTDTKRGAFTSRDIRFTTRVETQSGKLREILYAAVLEWPENRRVTIKSLANDLALLPKAITNVELLGSSSKVAWSRRSSGLVVELPENRPCDHAYVLKITAD